MTLEMLESLRVIFAEESLPFDESLARRLEVAKLIGLTFFYNSNSTPPLRVGVDDDGYWQGWRMTREDREASIMSIFKLTTDILVGNVPMAIELATQACLLSGGRLPTAPAWTGKEYEQEITERMATLDEMINSLGGEEETAAIAETRWPWTPVAASLLTALRTFYKQMEPPIISKVRLQIMTKDSLPSITEISSGPIDPLVL